MNILLFIIIILFELILFLFQQSQGALVLRPIKPENSNETIYDLVYQNTMDNCKGYNTSGYTEHYKEQFIPRKSYTTTRNKRSDFLNAGIAKTDDNENKEPDKSTTANSFTNITDGGRFKKKFVPYTNRSHNALHPRDCGKRKTKQSYYIPVEVVVDSSFLHYHQDIEYESYIMTAMNMVNDYFSDASIGEQILVSVVQILYIDKESEAFSDTIAKKRLKKFCEWANINKPDVTRANHFDVALLLTRDKIMNHNGTRPVIGATYQGAACMPCKACAVVEDIGLLLGVNIAHLLGHLIGAPNDRQVCPGNEDCHLKYSYVMATQVLHDRLIWSTRSRNAIHNFFHCGSGYCLVDEPPTVTYQFHKTLPGVIYSADSQCNMLRNGSKSCFLNKEAFCKYLFCAVGNETCVNEGNQPVQGTQCGFNEWCFNLACVHIGLRPNAINGQWSAWSEWSACSRSCGGGVRTARRICNNPKPTMGGINCLGPSSMHETCNTQHCLYSDPSSRAIQCSYFDHVPISGEYHEWTPWVLHTTSGEIQESCMLYCINQDNIRARLSPRVRDGTTCRFGTKDVCIDGTCHKVGCDFVLGSDAVEDRCRICGGPGTECTEVENTFNPPTANHSKVILVTKIPKWSTHIRVYETKPSHSNLAITIKNGLEIIIGPPNSNITGLFEVQDKIGYYTHLQPSRAYIIMKGPLPIDIDLFIVANGSGVISPVHYSYMLFKSEPIQYIRTTEKPPKRPKCPCNCSDVPADTDCDAEKEYGWEHILKSSCSARCEIGTALSTPRCVSIHTGLVGDEYCSGMKMPPEISFACNIRACQIRWRAGPWMCGCPMYRLVVCMKEARGWHDSDIIVDSSLCQGPKPVNVTTDCKDDMNIDQIFDVKLEEGHTSRYCLGPIEPLNRLSHKHLDNECTTANDDDECLDEDIDDDSTSTTTKRTTTTKICYNGKNENAKEQPPKCQNKIKHGKKTTKKPPCNPKKDFKYLNKKFTKTTIKHHTTKTPKMVKNKKYSKATTKHRTPKDSLYDYYYYDQEPGIDIMNTKVRTTKNAEFEYNDEIQASATTTDINKPEGIHDAKKKYTKINKSGIAEDINEKTDTTLQMKQHFPMDDDDYDYDIEQTSLESMYKKIKSKDDNLKTIMKNSTKVNRDEAIKKLNKSTHKSISQIKQQHRKDYNENDIQENSLESPRTTINLKYDDLKYVITKSTRTKKDETNRELRKSNYDEYNDYNIEKTTLESTYANSDLKYDDFKSIMKKSTKLYDKDESKRELRETIDNSVSLIEPHYNDYNIKKTTLKETFMNTNSKYDDLKSIVKKSTKVNKDDSNQEVHKSTDKPMLQMKPHFHMDYNDFIGNEYKILDKKADNPEGYKNGDIKSNSATELPRKYLCATKDCLKNTYGNFKNLASILKSTSLEYKDDIDEALHKLKRKINKENNKRKRDVNYNKKSEMKHAELEKHLENILHNINNLKVYVSDCTQDTNSIRQKNKRGQMINRRIKHNNSKDKANCCGFSYIEDYNNSCDSEITVVKLICANYIDGRDIDYVVKELGNDLPITYEIVQPA